MNKIPAAGCEDTYSLIPRAVAIITETYDRSFFSRIRLARKTIREHAMAIEGDLYLLFVDNPICCFMVRKKMIDHELMNSSNPREFSFFVNWCFMPGQEFDCTIRIFWCEMIGGAVKVYSHT